MRHLLRIGLILTVGAVLAATTGLLSLRTADFCTARTQTFSVSQSDPEQLCIGMTGSWFGVQVCDLVQSAASDLPEMRRWLTAQSSTAPAPYWAQPTADALVAQTNELHGLTQDVIAVGWPLPIAVSVSPIWQELSRGPGFRLTPPSNLIRTPDVARLSDDQIAWDLFFLYMPQIQWTGLLVSAALHGTVAWVGAALAYRAAARAARYFRLDPSMCQLCGYPRGNSAVCSECGTPLASRRSQMSA